MMKFLHVMMMVAGVGVLVYSLHPRHWRTGEVQMLDSAAIAQALARKERKS